MDIVNKEHIKSFILKGSNSDVAVNIPLILAPMSGVTNSAFRRLIRELNPGALGLSVTEFISVEGLTRQNIRSLEMMRFKETDRPISIQIFGGDIDRMVESAKMVEDCGADVVDINSGCPVPKVVKRGGGCELMRQSDHLINILEKIKGRISIPLTLKIRSGWDSSSINCLEIAKRAESVGVAMVTIHGRTRVDLYRGYADWDIVQNVASSVKIPIIGSGDVIDFESAKERFRDGISGLMIGRGAMMNPWIFNDIITQYNGFELVKRDVSDYFKVVLRYIDLLREDLPDKAVVGKVKQLATQMIRDFRGAVDCRRSITQSSDLVQIINNLSEYSKKYTGICFEKDEALNCYE